MKIKKLLRQIKAIRLGRNSRGVALIKVMLAMSSIISFTLIDLHRQKKNLIASRRRLAMQAVVDFRASLQHWLGHPGTIAYSFGEHVNEVLPSSAVAVPPPTPLPTNVQALASRRQVRLYTSNAIILPGRVSAPPGEREENADVSITPGTPDPFVITNLVQVNNGDGVLTVADDPDPRSGPNRVLLRQGTVEGMSFIGEPIGTNSVSSLDDAGWVYIRSIWVDNWEPYNTAIPLDVKSREVLNIVRDGGNQVRGKANLAVLVWVFNNLLDNPGLNCRTQNNCTRYVMRLPIDIWVDSTNGNIVDGTYGLDCEETIRQIAVSSIARPPTCVNGDEIFKKIGGINVGPSSDDASIQHYIGHCCGPVREVAIEEQ